MRKQSVENMSSTIEQLIEIHEVDVNEITINGVKVYEVLPKDKSLLKVDKVILLTHGGAYVSMNEKTSILEGIALSGKGNYRVLAVDYRMPPEHPFPAAIEDCVAVYKALLNEYSSEKIAIVGGSAGGGLAMTTTLSIRDEMLPLPAAVIANTPWSDMNKIGDTYFTNEYVDPALITYDGYVESAALLYANGEDLMNPLLSPVYADYSKGFPPTFLSSGTRDLFLSNTVRLHRALRKENIEAELHVFEAMWHSLFMLPVEGTELVNEMLIFLETHLS
jgi:acetyl esterase/lipase